MINRLHLMVTQNTLALLNHPNTETTVPLVFEVPLRIFQISLLFPICSSKGQGIYLDRQLHAFTVRR